MLTMEKGRNKEEEEDEEDEGGEKDSERKRMARTTVSSVKRFRNAACTSAAINAWRCLHVHRRGGEPLHH